MIHRVNFTDIVDHEVNQRTSGRHRAIFLSPGGDCLVRDPRLLQLNVDFLGDLVRLLQGLDELRIIDRARFRVSKQPQDVLLLLHQSFPEESQFLDILGLGFLQIWVLDPHHIP